LLLVNKKKNFSSGQDTTTPLPREVYANTCNLVLIHMIEQAISGKLVDVLESPSPASTGSR
jgi:hypothetical protein